MPKHIACLLFLVVGLTLFGANNNVYFNHLNVKDGLVHNNTVAIYQDEIGTMWFGGRNGLCRYNGQKIDIIYSSQNDQGLTQNSIRTITGNKKGKLYILAQNDLVEYDIKSQQITPLLTKDVREITFSDNHLWVVTQKNILLYNLETGKFTPYEELSTQWGDIFCLHAKNNRLWIGTTNGCYTRSLKKKDRWATILQSTTVKTIFIDSKQNIWMGTENQGIYVRTPQGETKNYQHEIGRPSLSNNEVRTVIDDEFGNIWIGTFFGLNKYNPIKDEWQTYNNISNISYSLSHASIYTLYRDMQNNMWVGTYFGGINYFNPQADVFNFYGSNRNDDRFISYPFVGQMTEDKSGNLWICTEGGGLNLFNRQTQKFKHFYHNENDPRSIPANNLKSIWYDKEEHKLYIGSHGQGMFIYDIDKNNFTSFTNIPEKSNSLPNNTINGIQSYKNDLVILTQRGITVFGRKTGTCRPLFSNPEIQKKIARMYTFEAFFIDSKENLWLAYSNSGLLKINLRSEKITEYLPDYNNPKSIGKFRILTICENKDNSIYFGTCGSGLYKYNEKSDDFTRYTREQGDIYSNYCFAIGESSYEHLYILHEKGISLFSTKNRMTDYSSRFPNITFAQGSSIFFTNDGETYFGSTEGLISLYEQQLYTTYKDYKLYFDKLYINNQEVNPNDGTHTLDRTLPLCKNIKLAYNQNNFSIFIGTTNFISNTNYKYEYKLEGFDEEWISMNNNQISYTNINPGKYTLKVRSVEKYDPMRHEIEMDILITPPFYASIWAYLFYIIICSYALFYIFRFNKKQALLKASLSYERKEKEHIQELNQLKLRFFTNISHEFRTPLSLIIAQLELLLQTSKVSGNVYNRILKAYKNTHYLRDLITELLDFRKLDQGYIQLHVEHRNIINFITDIYAMFFEYAEKRKISYHMDAPDKEILLWFDPTQMQKVINNLLSNAFKYTPEKGAITIQIKQVKEQLLIIVKNTGKGIRHEDREKIFERFYQSKNEQNSNFSLGSGIGLALTKGIVELHHGTIEVQSIPDVETTFTVSLLTGDEHFTHTEKFEHDNVQYGMEQLVLTEAKPETEEVTEDKDNTPEDKKTLLIIDDNEELLDVLKDIFKSEYNIYTAINGVDGIEAAYQIVPDLIISDVMMPRMSGKEMCFKIKHSIELSHIPIILLTAKNSIEYKIEGYQFGADDYITKPFNINMLKTRCANLIRNRKLLTQKNILNEIVPKTANTTIDRGEQAFLDKTIKIIRKQISTPNFDMDMLANELGTGRSTLYVKLKDICGLTPNELTLKIRLEESAKLLIEQPEMSISEISYQIGFSTPKYFSKCFKSIYASTPQEYRKNWKSSVKDK